MENEGMEEKKEIAQPVAEKPTIILTVKDRLLFQAFFPERGNLVTKIMEEDIAKKVVVGQEEAKEIELKNMPGGGGVTWKEEKAKDKGFFFTAAEIQFLKDQVERLNKAESFTTDTAQLAKKIKAL